MLSRNTIIILAVLTVFALLSTIAYAEGFEKKDVFIYKGFSNGGYLGVSILKIPLVEKKELGVKFGVKVTIVKKKSAAEKSGIKKGDVIQYFNDEKIRVPNDLISIVRDTKPGTKTNIKIIRNKKKKTIIVKLDDYNKQFKFKKFSSKRAFLGVYLENMSSDFGEYFGVKNGEGALIKKVDADTPAEEAEFKSGDVIIKIENKVIKSSKDVSKALSEFKKGDKVNIVFLRHKKRKNVNVELDERSGFGNFNFKFDNFKYLKKLKGLKHLKDLNLKIHGLEKGLYFFKDFDVDTDFDSDKKKILIEKKSRKIKEKKKWKKKVSEKDQERL